MTVACTGIGVAAGAAIAIGRSYRLPVGPVQAKMGWVEAQQIEAEVERFREAVELAGEQLRAVRDQLPESISAEIRDFLDTHLLMLADRAIAEAPTELIRAEGLRAEWALQLRRDALVSIFEEMEDPYLRARRDDIDHVVSAIQKILTASRSDGQEDLRGRIVLAEDLTPADIILLSNQGIAGFVTESGGPMSHTAILAGSLGIPAIVGARGSTTCLLHDEPLILDAATGVVLAAFDAATQELFEQARASMEVRRSQLRGLREEPGTTRDGVRVALLANIELAGDVPHALDSGAEGVGLYRTEFLYMNRQTPPTEEEHFEAYREVVEGMGGRPVTIRTLDLGADKHVDGACSVPSANPALGLRAIRLCLKEPQLFRPQIRAILRVSALAPVRIMLPMLTNVWEAMQARALIEDVMRELTAQNIAHDSYVPVGGMIEVPAAALAAASFVQHLDFLSIGTNDLIQYTLAINRVDDEVNYLYDPAHPAVLRLIQLTIDACTAGGIEVSMCGEMAGDTRFVPFLIGMGLRVLSMQPLALPIVKEVIRDLNAAQLQREVRQLMTLLDTIDSTELLNRLDRLH
jgi:phosphotransferase system enzyme I (PtsI)